MHGSNMAHEIIYSVTNVSIHGCKMGEKRIESLIKEQASGWNAGKDETQVGECRKEMHMQKKEDTSSMMLL